MSRSLAEQIIYMVEHSDEPPLQHIYTVARNVLDININDLTEVYLQSPQERPSPKIFAPREEWAFKWLITNLTSGLGRATSQRDHIEFVRDKRVAALFVYLVHVLPPKVLKKTLQKYHHFCPNFKFLEDEDSQEETFPANDEKRSRKRRKISPSGSNFDAAKRSGIVQQNSPELALLMCSGFSHCVEAIHLAQEQVREELQYASTGWITDPVEAALFVSRLLRLSLSGVYFYKNDWRESWILKSIRNILKIWTFAFEFENISHLQEEENPILEFCLTVFLDLILLLKDREQGIESVIVIDQLQSLISRHIILPLGLAVNINLESGWRLEDKTLSFANLRQVVDSARKFFEGPFLGGLDEEMSKTIHKGNRAAEYGRLLFDIAIRSTAPTTTRQRHQNQISLEGLFIGLLYICAPDFPQEIILGTASLQDFIESAKNSATESPICNTVVLEGLLNVAIERNVALSLPILSHFMSALLVSRSAVSPWPSIAKILKLDCNVLLPNSGMPCAADCLDHVLAGIEYASHLPDSNYSLLRDDIIIPLISGFAKARDLGRFVKLWVLWLESAMKMRSEGQNGQKCQPRLIIWSDEDVLEHARQVFKAYATTSMVNEVVAELVATLKLVGNKFVSTPYSPFAAASVLDVIAESRFEHLSTPNSIIEGLFVDTVEALKSRSFGPSEHWRLWRLIRHCITHLPKCDLPASQFQVDHSSIHFVSLRSIIDRKDSGVDSERTGILQEATECFRLLVCACAQIESVPTELRETIESEIEHLISLLESQLSVQSSEQASLPLLSWDGQIMLMESKAQLSAACVAVLFQNPQVLLLNMKTTEKLLLVLCHHLTSPAGYLNSQIVSPTILTALGDLLSLDDLQCQSDALYSFIDSLLTAIKQSDRRKTRIFDLLNIAQVVPANRTQAANFADHIISDLQGFTTGSEIEDIATEIAVLEKLIKTATVSVGKPKNWKSMIEFVECLRKKIESPPSRAYHIAIRCVQKTFQALWSRVLQLDESEKTKGLLQEILQWCTNEIDSELPFDYGLSKFLILRDFVNAFWQDKEKIAFAVPQLRLAVFREKYFQKLIGDMEKILSFERDNHPHSFGIWVQSISSCADLCEATERCASLVKSFYFELMLHHPKLGDEDTPDEILRSLEGSYCRLQQIFPIGVLLPLALRRISLDFEPFATSRAFKDPFVSNRAMKVCMQKACNFVALLRPPLLAPTLELINGEQFAPQFLRDKWRSGEENGVLASDLRAAEEFARVAIINRLTLTDLQTLPGLAQQLRPVLSLTCASGAQNSEYLCMILECCQYVLEKFPLLVNQHAIDELLSSLASLASNKTTTQGRSGAISAAVFDRLCTVLDMVLERFRRRLQGRYHLLLTVMTNLLRCLFCSPGSSSSPRTKQTQIDFISTLPNWLLESPSALPTSAAEHYTSLLTSICDPSPASVKATATATSTNNLTDETKKAKRTAGQYMQYLIMEYARCTLDGSIQPAAKAKLQPGLYAVLDAMTLDVMKAMNAAMDSSSRAIFKGLYADYQRFGKWDKN